MLRLLQARNSEGENMAPRIKTCWRITFRWTLPCLQFAVCCLALWPLRADLVLQVHQLVDAYLSRKEPAPTRPFRPANLSQEQYRQEQDEEVRLRTPLALNAPLLSFIFFYGWVTGDQYSEPWAPQGIDFQVWWALLSSVGGVILWWSVGRSMDAIVAARRREISPHLLKTEAVLAAVWIAFGIWLANAAWRDLHEVGSGSFYVIGVGGALWTLLGTVTVSAWVLQRKIAKKAA